MAIVVRNGPPADSVTREAPLRPGSLTDPHLVYVGALESQDGVDDIPELLATLRDAHGLEGLRATIVGFGAREEPLRRELAARGLGERVRLTGRVEHAEVLDIVAQADVCLDTAPCNEFNHRTTMVKISEYLALGRPTVSFALEETVLTAGDAVEFAACGDWDDFVARVAGLAADEERRLDLGRRARERAAGLIWDRQGEILLDGYARMLEAA
jgi:glycosyltransferase involved in cell wall biosynthesis